LFSGTGGLHHLVHRAIALFEKALAEAHRAIVDDPRFLEGEQGLRSRRAWE
jgi:hypothetical protein